MLLGKRPRPPIKRTTSLSQITFDLNICSDENGSSNYSSHETPPPQPPQQQPPCDPPFTGEKQTVVVGGYQVDQRFLAANNVSPRPRSASAGFLEPNFLKACCFCKRRLISGRDIYMYRGDSAFCSLECRQQQMTQDERKEKCSLLSKKQIPAVSIKIKSLQQG